MLQYKREIKLLRTIKKIKLWPSIHKSTDFYQLIMFGAKGREETECWSKSLSSLSQGMIIKSKCLTKSAQEVQYFSEKSWSRGDNMLDRRWTKQSPDTNAC